MFRAKHGATFDNEGRALAWKLVVNKCKIDDLAALVAALCARSEAALSKARARFERYRRPGRHLSKRTGALSGAYWQCIHDLIVLICSWFCTAHVMLDEMYCELR